MVSVSIELKDNCRLPDVERLKVIRSIANGLDFIPGISVRIGIYTTQLRVSFAWEGKPFAEIIYQENITYNNPAGKPMCFVGQQGGANAGLFEDSPDQTGRRIAALLLDKLEEERGSIEKIREELKNRSPMCFWGKS